MAGAAVGGKIQTMSKKVSNQLCDFCQYCTHAPNLFQQYWWCSWFGKEVRSIVTKCNKNAPKK